MTNRDAAADLEAIKSQQSNPHGNAGRSVLECLAYWIKEAEARRIRAETEVAKQEQLHTQLTTVEEDRTNLMTMIQKVDQALKYHENFAERDAFMELVHKELVAYQDKTIKREYTTYYERQDGVKHPVRGKLFLQHRGLSIYTHNRVLTMALTGTSIARDVPFHDKQQLINYMDRNWEQLMQICTAAKALHIKRKEQDGRE